MEERITTPHISAYPSQIAKTVLMPGDPLRSRFIAEHFLEGAVLFNDIRGVQGYTGTYHGQKVSVMASGMGLPSIGIYSYELFTKFGVDNILRIGSAGSLQENVKVRDLIFGMAACSESGYADQYGLSGHYSPIASYPLLRTATEVTDKLGFPYHVGNLFSTEVYYAEDPEYNLGWCKLGILAVEMESYSLYCNAARCGKNALTICTISNSLLTGEELSPEDRQTSFTDMMEVALNTAVALGGN